MIHTSVSLIISQAAHDFPESVNHFIGKIMKIVNRKCQCISIWIRKTAFRDPVDTFTDFIVAFKNVVLFDQ